MLFFSARTKNVRLKGHFLGTDVFRLVRTDPRCVGEPSVTHYCRMDINNYGLCVDKAGVFRVQRCPFPVHVFNGLDLSINYWEGNGIAAIWRYFFRNYRGYLVVFWLFIGGMGEGPWRLALWLTFLSRLNGTAAKSRCSGTWTNLKLLDQTWANVFIWVQEMSHF